MPTRLIIYRDDRVDQVDLTKRDVRIGRAPENDIVLEDAEKTVSRYHAELREEQGNYVIIDLNSQNGVWVDGQRVHRATLKPGHPVVLGKVRVVLEASPDAVAPSAAEPVSPRPEETLLAPRQKTGERVVRPKPAARSAAAPPSSLVSRLANPKVLGLGLALMLAAVGFRFVLSRTSGSPDRSEVVAPSPRASQPPDAKPRADQPPGRPLPASEQPTVPATPTPANQPSTTQPAPPQVSGPADPALTDARRQRLVRARLLIARGEYDNAISQLQRVLKDGPSREASAALEQARVLRQAAVTDRAASIVQKAARLEGANQLVAAQQQLFAAREIDPSHPGLADAIARVTAKMQQSGEEVFRRARQYDALGRAREAIPLYEQAIQLLPPDHRDRGTAAERLPVLKSGVR